MRQAATDRIIQAAIAATDRRERLEREVARLAIAAPRTAMNVLEAFGLLRVFSAITVGPTDLQPPFCPACRALRVECGVAARLLPHAAHRLTNILRRVEEARRSYRACVAALEGIAA